jgi:hypothetical protein
MPKHPRLSLEMQHAYEALVSSKYLAERGGDPNDCHKNALGILSTGNFVRREFGDLKDNKAHYPSGSWVRAISRLQGSVP